MTNTNRKMLEHSKHMAEMSSFHRVKVGCVVALKSKVLAAGFNTYKTHPLQLKYNRYRQFDDISCGLPAALHAEIMALSQIADENIDWGKVDVYVYRLRRDQPYGLAAPCPACTQFMKDLGIRSVWYTGDDNIYHKEIC